MAEESRNGGGGGCLAVFLALWWVFALALAVDRRLDVLEERADIIAPCEAEDEGTWWLALGMPFMRAQERTEQPEGGCPK